MKTTTQRILGVTSVHCYTEGVHWHRPPVLSITRGEVTLARLLNKFNYAPEKFYDLPRTTPGVLSAEQLSDDSCKIRAIMFPASCSSKLESTEASE